MQVHDTTEAVKQIGFAATVAVVLLIGAGIVARYLFKYFTERLDKKDEQIIKATEQVAEVVEARHADLGRMVASQESLNRGQEKITEALETLADEIRRPRGR